MTKIEWCEKTWNPVIGCTKISPGCKNCYAEIMAKRLKGVYESKSTDSLRGYAKVIDSGPDGSQWSGKTFFNEEKIYESLSWKKPRHIFVCSMADLFHDTVLDSWIDRVMAMIALTPRHTYHILTKRPERMEEYFSRGKNKLAEAWKEACYEIGVGSGDDDVDTPPCFIHNRCFGYTEKSTTEWPLTNLCLDVTIENQEMANYRIPFLLRTPAAKRGVSVEPMLGEIDFYDITLNGEYYNTLKGFGDISGSNGKFGGPKIDWVICGGESGSKARPTHPDWVRSLRDQCQDAGTPFFFKGWGEYRPCDVDDIIHIPDSKLHEDHKAQIVYAKLGKKHTGAIIDEKEWREMP